MTMTPRSSSGVPSALVPVQWTSDEDDVAVGRRPQGLGVEVRDRAQQRAPVGAHLVDAGERARREQRLLAAVVRVEAGEHALEVVRVLRSGQTFDQGARVAHGASLRRLRSSASSARPATSPQNGAPIPSAVTPEAVTANVIIAASRCSGRSSPPQRGAERAEQRQAATASISSGRRRGQKRGGERRAEAEDEVRDAARDRGDPAAPGLGVGVGARGEGGGDRREVDRVAAERRAAMLAAPSRSAPGAAAGR